MLTGENLIKIVPRIENMLFQLNTLVAMASNTTTLTDESAESIARFAAALQKDLDAIDLIVTGRKATPPAVPRERPISPALPVHAELIFRYLPTVHRYLSEMLELANDLITGQRYIDREARTSLADRSSDARLALLGAEMQFYRLPRCRGRIIFDTTFRLDGECSVDRCFCGK